MLDYRRTLLLKLPSSRRCAAPVVDGAGQTMTVLLGRAQSVEQSSSRAVDALALERMGGGVLSDRVCDVNELLALRSRVVEDEGTCRLACTAGEKSQRDVELMEKLPE